MDTNTAQLHKEKKIYNLKMRNAHPIKHAVECGNLARYETSAHNQNAIGCKNLISCFFDILIFGLYFTSFFFLTSFQAC